MPDIQYLGHACFRLRGRDGIIICDPFSRSIGLDLGRPNAHIVTVSHDHPDHNYVAAVKPTRDRLFVVSGPGEYEVNGIFIHGIRTYHDAERGKQRGFNTVYTIHLDDLMLCHLGDLGHELSQSQLEEIGDVDVLFVPVGGGETIGPAEAVNVISQIEPRVVVPMHFALSSQHVMDEELLPLDRFLHEVGLKDLALEEKLTISAGSLGEGETTRIIPMRALSE